MCRIWRTIPIFAERCVLACVCVCLPHLIWTNHLYRAHTHTHTHTHRQRAQSFFLSPFAFSLSLSLWPAEAAALLCSHLQSLVTCIISSFLHKFFPGPNQPFRSGPYSSLSVFSLTCLHSRCFASWHVKVDVARSMLRALLRTRVFINLSGQTMALWKKQLVWALAATLVVQQSELSAK